jgi:hypothetical protein
LLKTGYVDLVVSLFFLKAVGRQAPGSASGKNCPTCQKSTIAFTMLTTSN